MNTRASFGMWVRQQRRSSNLTQAELAKQVGCAEETVQKIETDVVRPSKHLAARFAKILGVHDGDREAIVAFARGSRPAPDGLQPALPSPTVTPPHTRQTHLPAQLTGLIGRLDDVDRICTSLLRSDVRLVTLTGPGGTGKTRVAVESATQLITAFANGVSFVDLSSITDSKLVLPTIARQLGVVEQTADTLEELLTNALREQSLLLVLDNFEQVIDAAPVVVQLLVHCPFLKLLVTSRTPLEVVGEHEIPIPPLGLPKRTQLPSLERFKQYEAVQLFIERTHAVQPLFAVTAANVPAIAELCHRLDGLPLAIELVAAWTKLFEPHALLTRLDRLMARASSEHGRPARQQTVWNTIDWSYGLLNSDEQALFRQIGVFVGGATLAAIEVVVGDDTITVIDGVSDLLSQSLIRRLGWSPDDPETNPRIGMLETIREYAMAQLMASPDAAAVRKRHAHYFTALAEAAQEQLRGPQQADVLRKLDVDYDNMRAVLDWSLHGGDITVGMRLAGALAEFWEVGQYSSEGRRWLDALLAADTEPSNRRINALYGAVVLAINQADTEGATLLVEHHTATAQALGDPFHIAQSLVVRAQVAKLQDDVERAMLLFEQALVLFRAHGATQQIADILLNLGILKGLNQGNLVEAAPLLDESLAFYQQLEYAKGVIYVLLTQGILANLAADSERAVSVAQPALRLAWSSQFLLQVAPCLSTLAVAAIHQQQPERAVRFSSAADAILTDLHITLAPSEQAVTDYWLNIARTMLDEETFAATWAEAQTVPREQIVAEALS